MSAASRPSPHEHRDIVVIGASAGGLDALRQLVGGLPADLPAAVLVVVHQSPDHRSQLHAILQRAGPLPCELAIHGQPLTPGRIVVAPPDNHLLLRAGQVAVVRGPKENGHRPAVDPLFRSAAAAYGRRVIGVVLSGALDCGTAGLLHVRARGGVTVVQHPDDAIVPSMPLSALRHLEPDHVAPAAELGAIIARLVREPLAVACAEDLPDGPGTPAGFVCPACNGAMQESSVGGFAQFTCHVGHKFSVQALVQSQLEGLEAALWAGVRALEETARVARRAAALTPAATPMLLERASTHEHYAGVIKRMLLDDGWPPAEALRHPPDEVA